ncbi:MAG: ABC transporter ATP-binding protein [Sedimentisphaerales bacterium]|nr:ABC transporter ATP-binding protein [Sedimentisphaerales bacterium]
MSEIVLETKGLTKYFSKKAALESFDLKIPQGCICGFIGRNGAGKTTAIKLLLGFLEPTAGSSSVLGCNSMSLTPDIRQRIGYVTEGHRLFRGMTISQLEKFQKPFFEEKWDDKFFAEMIEYFDLSKKQKVKHLSNGQRAQVSLALALAPHPEILVMDDPTLGLDPAIRRQFLQGIIRLIMQQGRTVLFSSHILSDVERVSNRVVVLDKGRLRANCSIDKFRESVKKARFSFKGEVPAIIEIEGLMNYRILGKELEVVLVETSNEKIKEWANTAKAENYEIIPMNLEDQFIEFTEPKRRDKQFQWEAN